MCYLHVKLFPKKCTELEFSPNTSQLANPQCLIYGTVSTKFSRNLCVFGSQTEVLCIMKNWQIFAVECCFFSFTDNCCYIFLKFLLLHKPKPEKMNSIVTRKDWDSVKAIQ